ncbi:hypothetical protein M758_UG312800 [Ceratodon purpureus]|nr:hypothetical protein M758_UG312800 [Ceratodon purpureus]
MDSRETLKVLIFSFPQPIVVEQRVISRSVLSFDIVREVSQLLDVGNRKGRITSIIFILVHCPAVLVLREVETFW